MREAETSGLCSEHAQLTRNGKSRVRFEKTGLVIGDELDDDELRALVRQLGRMQNAGRWWIGDALCLVQNRWQDGQPSFGEWDEILAELGLEPSTGAHYRRVARAIPIERRRERLSWSHHERVARLPAAEQEELLERAEREGLSSQALHVAMMQRGLGRPTEPSAPDLEQVQPRIIAPAASIARWKEAAAERGVSLPALVVEPLDRLVGDPRA
jgi:hypothetical protein